MHCDSQRQTTSSMLIIKYSLKIAHVAPHSRTAGSLKAFDAAARHLSFTRAAEELDVTPAAISHQIKELEDADRRPPVPAHQPPHAADPPGRNPASPPSPMRSMSSPGRCRRIRQLENPKQLRVIGLAVHRRQMAGSAPRPLPRDRCPDADVRIDVSATVLDFDRDDVDVAIRFGNGELPGPAGRHAVPGSRSFRCAARSC